MVGKKEYTHARRYATLRDVAQRLQVLFPRMSPTELEAMLHITFETMGDILLEYGQIRLGNSAVLNLTRKDDGHAARFLGRATSKKRGPRRKGTYRATVSALPAWKEKYTRFEQGIQDGSTRNWDQLKATKWSQAQTKISNAVRDLRADRLLQKWAKMLRPRRG